MWLRSHTIMVYAVLVEGGRASADDGRRLAADAERWWVRWEADGEKAFLVWYCLFAEWHSIPLASFSCTIMSPKMKIFPAGCCNYFAARWKPTFYSLFTSRWLHSPFLFNGEWGLPKVNRWLQNPVKLCSALLALMPECCWLRKSLKCSFSSGGFIKHRGVSCVYATICYYGICGTKASTNYCFLTFWKGYLHSQSSSQILCYNTWQNLVHSSLNMTSFSDSDLIKFDLITLFQLEHVT